MEEHLSTNDPAEFIKAFIEQKDCPLETDTWETLCKVDSGPWESYNANSQTRGNGIVKRPSG